MIETMLYLILAFGGGAYLGQKGVKPQQATSPDKWAPTEHREMINSCRTACSKDKFKSYDSLRGECSCSQ